MRWGGYALGISKVRDRSPASLIVAVAKHSQVRLCLSLVEQLTDDYADGDGDGYVYLS